MRTDAVCTWQEVNAVSVLTDLAVRLRVSATERFYFIAEVVFC